MMDPEHDAPAQVDPFRAQFPFRPESPWKTWVEITGCIQVNVMVYRMYVGFVGTCWVGISVSKFKGPFLVTLVLL